MICNFKNIKSIVNAEKMEVCVISYGGSCSNLLVNTLEKNNIICQTPIWHKILCHSPDFLDIDIPMIYIYDNPIKSFFSMKNRGEGWWDVNQRKLSNDNNIELSDENLLRLMIKQFNTWTACKKDNLLLLKSEELFESKIVDKLELFLNKKLSGFPIEFKKPKTDLEKITFNKDEETLFEKYKKEINFINNF